MADEKDFDGGSGDLKASTSARKKDADTSPIVLNAAIAQEVLLWLSGADGTPPSFSITDRKERTTQRMPPPPFITSTLQQVASRQLGFSPSRTMSLAQQLYEAGHITYMRTDSPTLSVEAQTAIKKMVTDVYGAEYLHEGKGKAGSVPKNAQEAHEAIRPAQVQGRFRRTEDLEVDADQRRLYDLILRRTLASAMRPSRTETVSVVITATKATDPGTIASFRAAESRLADPGYLICENGRTADNQSSNDRSTRKSVATLVIGDKLQLSREAPSVVKAEALADPTEEQPSEGDLDEVAQVTPEEEEGKVEDAAEAWMTAHAGLRCTSHDTRPPSRFTEASFIKELEAVGVGRPSTYASILSILKERGYIVVDKQTILPTPSGIVVSQFLAKHFPQVVDENFTAEMEKALDQIARGEQEKVSFLQQFFLGNQPVQPVPSGLLGQVDTVLRSSPKHTRSFVIPALAHLGEFAIYRDSVSFMYKSRLPGGEGSSNDGEPSTPVLQKVLPSHIQNDCRLWTTETIEELRANASEVSLTGKVLGIVGDDSATMKYQVTIKNGPYSKFLHLAAVEGETAAPVDQVLSTETLSTIAGNNAANGKRARKVRQVNKQIPVWVTDSCDLRDAIDFASLPKTIGTHPDTQTPIVLSLTRGKLRLTADGFPFQAELPPFTYVRDISEEGAVEALRTSTVPSELLKIHVGHWEEEGGDIYIRRGPFGLYLQCGKLIAGMGKYDQDTITLDIAITRLRNRQRKLARAGGGGRGKKADKKTPSAGGKGSKTTPEAVVVEVDTAGEYKQATRKKAKAKSADPETQPALKSNKSKSKEKKEDSDESSSVPSTAEVPAAKKRGRPRVQAVVEAPASMS